jgi:hypothetical protein
LQLRKRVDACLHDRCDAIGDETGGDSPDNDLSGRLPGNTLNAPPEFVSACAASTLRVTYSSPLAA